ncbi:MAG: single-stranded DNA-binding protein [Bacteroidales bacterium]|jgi:single-strand DNA-binding protein|nr:single-stranded DNA-binding protein [Bacteroidales bacterium]
MVNKVILLGRAGKDPEVRHLDNNMSVANFTLATNESYMKDGSRVEQTEWHNIVSWRNAKYIEDYVRKGMLLYVEGRLRSRSWDDKNGNKHYITEVLADTLHILSPKDNSQGNQATVPPISAGDTDSDPTGGLPF